MVLDVLENSSPQLSYQMHRNEELCHPMYDPDAPRSGFGIGLF
jgi:hypothetical protein